jgi:hypothetical protein
VASAAVFTATTQAGEIASGQTAITLSANKILKTGQTVTGTGIAAGTKVAAGSDSDDTALVLDTATTAAISGGTLTFGGVKACTFSSTSTDGCEITAAPKADIVCTPCAAGTLVLAASSAAKPTLSVCEPCVAATAGSCNTANGCPADFFQAAGHAKQACTETATTSVAADKTACEAVTTGTCTETATTSVAADKTACEAVTALDSNTACIAVGTTPTCAAATTATAADKALCSGVARLFDTFDCSATVLSAGSCTYTASPATPCTYKTAATVCGEVVKDGATTGSACSSAAADTSTITCTACAAGKSLTNAGLADAVQTATSCTTPAAAAAAAASGAFRSVANAAATAVAASFAAAALM